MTPLKKLATCATTWLVIGLAGGVFYREFTKANDFTGWTQLKVVHTHCLALGFMLTLIVLVLERVFTLSAHRGAFATYFWGFNLGLLLTITMLVIHGVMQVHGNIDVSPAISGIAGLGHIGLSVGLVGLMVALFTSLPATTPRPTPEDQLTTHR
ncbi:DUF2871 domain-containing protein [Cutibacterium sp.]|uniref:DUF2871 domain-containing protein n=1 Tax=Cutibacterium sp. TaxID=1912221 RepID=UPI0026DD277F|nr:DUF2871 domain-containing protein [Cutibacterium sp.]MDO4413041.1 DUF2871 domain-containing protein [Cutibacterium sp.]